MYRRYAGAGMWDKAQQIRNTMRQQGVKKMPGRVDVTVKEANGTLGSRWIANDTCYKEYAAIEQTLMGMFILLRKNGYVVDRRGLLQELEDSDECYHSEMLAIAWGLVNSPPHTLLYTLAKT